ncbi:MAG: DUF6242 domain-containing protein [Gallionella sp.]
MKKWFCMVIVAMVSTLLGGCGKFATGSSAPPPPWLLSTAGDGRVELNWTATPGVDYWVFAATDPALTAFNWTGLPNAQAVVAAPTPSYICGLIDGMTYYFATNGRINNGPGGPSSPTISLTPYNASAGPWTPVPISSTSSPDVYGLGYAGITTCANNSALSAAGMFAAVGAGGVIFTSPDGINWTQRSSPVSTNLNAVTGYAANQNNTITPGLLWVAVGNGGTAVYSTDGVNWLTSTSTTTTQTLRSILHVGSSFFAVGDGGTIISSGDGNTWSTNVSNTSNQLNGIAHGGYYVAVGNNGTIVANGGNGWVVQTSNTTSNLNQVAAIATAYGSIYVAVGNGGTIVTSDSDLHNGIWTALTPISGNPNLIGVTVEPRGVETTTAYTTAPDVDPWLGFISAAQFVAIDESGNTYTSVNGHDWTASATSVISCGTTCANALLSSGFGYVAAGNGGATAYAF